jgi:alpha-galactosidase
VKFLLSVWKDNRDALLDGELELNNPEQYYTTVTAATKEKLFVALYNDAPAAVKDKPRMIVMNATAARRVVLDVPANLSKRNIIVYDCTGKVVASRKAILKKGLHDIAVPPSGIIEITK